MHAAEAGVTLMGVQARGNLAAGGGGGVLYWNGDAGPRFVSYCAAGSAANGTAALASCVPCGAGTFQTMQGATACKACGAGSYSSEVGATTPDSCVACGAGKFSSGAGSGGPTSCEECAPGTYSMAGSAACAECHAGTYSSSVGASDSGTCAECPAGTFSTAAAAGFSSECLACGAGTFSFGQSSQCSLCQAGTYSSALSAASPATCAPCGVGKYSEIAGAASQASCQACPAGMYAPSKSFSYELKALTWADAEAACVRGGGHLASIESEEENRRVLNLVTAFHDYWIGYHFYESAGAWGWSDGTPGGGYSAWGEANPKTGSSLYDCTDFPSYPYTSANTSGLLAFWPYFREQFGIFPDAGPYEAAEGAWYNYDCSNGMGWVVGYVCSYAGSSACLRCAAGEYAPAGATSASRCAPCNGTAANSTDAAWSLACGASRRSAVDSGEAEGRALSQSR